MQFNYSYLLRNSSRKLIQKGMKRFSVSINHFREIYISQYPLLK